MAARIVRLGSPRRPREGVRLGTVRHPPRGVRKADIAEMNYYDLWLPELAPSANLLSFYRSKPLTGSRWAAFSRRYRSEMGKPDKQRLIAVLAEMSKSANFSVGCYCEDGDRCHRSLLRELLRSKGAVITKTDK